MAGGDVENKMTRHNVFKSLTSKFVAGAVIGLALTAGAARAQEVEHIQNQGWMKSLPKMLYLIDACIGHSPDRSEVVTKAWFVNPKQAAVRLESDNGWRAQCVIDRNSREVVRFDRLKATDRVPGEYAPAFIRRGQKTVEEHRPGLIRVEGYAGERLGWAYLPEQS